MTVVKVEITNHRVTAHFGSKCCNKTTGKYKLKRGKGCVTQSTIDLGLNLIGIKHIHVHAEKTFTCALHESYRPISAQQLLLLTVTRKALYNYPKRFRYAYAMSKVLFLGMQSFVLASTALI